MAVILIPAPRKNSFVTDNLVKTNFSASDTLFVGSAMRESPVIFRSFVQFDLKAIPANLEVASVTLRMFIKRNDLGEATKIFDVHRVVQRFKENEITWRKQPDWDWEIEASVHVTGGNIQDVEWDITELVRRWSRNEAKNYGLLIKAREEEDRYLVAFESRKSPNASHRPSLLVVVNEPQQPEIAQGGNFVYDFKKNLTTSNTWQYTQSHPAKAAFYNYFIQNKGTNPAHLLVQVSPGAIEK
ncbi:MAG TPA: DNRLRE domain-containing protein, partial [Verrucomicrobiae bacterium]|nr:DNRLRE domain-containing protein [Verrucomicrobiae bacterium]